MSTALTTTPAKISPLAVMAQRFNADPAKLLETLKATVFKEARSNEELQALVIVANAYNLNPLTKEIYAFPAKGGGITPVVSIDGWANLANSHPQMDGMDFEWEHDGNGKLVSCTCIIHRKDRQHPTRVTEYLVECKRNTDPWKMEHRMLRHKALCQAVRIAFGFSGVYDEDEAERIRERDVTPKASASPLFRDVPPLQHQGAADLLDVPAVALADQVQALCDKDGLAWPDVQQYLLDNGELDDKREKITDCTDDELRRIVTIFAQVAAGVKGGVA